MNKENQELLEAIKALNPKKGDASKLLEGASKAASALSIAAIMWIFNTTNVVKQEVSNIKIGNEIENRYTKESFDKINKFIEEPRFTKEHFDTKIEPLIKQINSNTAELNLRSDLFKELTEGQIKHEVRLKQIETMLLSLKTQ